MATLRPYQERALQQLRDAVRNGKKRIMLKMPTGSGKTELAKQIIENATAKGKRVFFTCPRIELIKQTSTRFLKYGIDHGVIQANHVMTAPHKPVQVCSIQTLNRRLWNNFDIIIIDEAHGAAAPIYRKYLGRRDPSGYIMIGLTATPYTRGLGAHVAEVNGPLFEELVEGATIAELIKDGHLVDVEIWAPSEPDLSGVRTVAGDYDEKQLGERTNRTELVGNIVSHWLRIAENRTTVCFAVNIAHSKEIVRQFVEAGVAAEHIDAYTKDDERDAILGRLRSGQTRVVSNVALLAEGFDLPSIGCMILARPTKSLTRYIQMVGRALRPAPGKEKALILDHSGTARRLGWPTEELAHGLDDGRRRDAKPRAGEERLPQVCPSCAYVKPFRVHKCPKCGFEPVRRSGVLIKDESLQKVERRNWSAHDKQAIFSALIGELNRMRIRRPSTKDGWVAHKYREMVGVWPRGLSWREGPMLDSVRRFLDHEAIKFRVRKAAEEKRRIGGTCPRCGSTNLSLKVRGGDFAEATCKGCGYGQNESWWLRRNNAVARVG